MRVLYFHQYFTTPDGAGGTRSYEMARRLVERGHQVTLVCGSSLGVDSGVAGGFIGGRRRGFVDGIEVIELALPYSNKYGLLKRCVVFFRFALKSIGIALSEKYDLLFATSTPLTIGLPGIVASALKRKPFVFEVRDLWPELPREMGVVTNPLVLNAMTALEWSSYHAATRCIGLSPGIVSGITRRGIEPRAVKMIPNGCDLELFDPEAGAALRPQGVEPEDLMAIFSGAHGIANGLDAVLDAAGELKKRSRTDIKLVFVGEGKLKPALQERATAEELDCCIFLDLMPKREITALHRGADVGLMILANVPAFYYGTSPNKFFDYIASGLPVLNNYPGWLSEMIDANSCGVVVPPQNAQAFADALEYLADHSEKRCQMGRNARRLAIKDFNRRQLADSFVDWLEEACKKSTFKQVANDAVGTFPA